MILANKSLYKDGYEINHIIMIICITQCFANFILFLVFGTELLVLYTPIHLFLFSPNSGGKRVDIQWDVLLLWPRWLLELGMVFTLGRWYWVVYLVVWIGLCTQLRLFTTDYDPDPENPPRIIEPGGECVVCWETIVEEVQWGWGCNHPEGVCNQCLPRLVRCPLCNL